MNHFSVDDDKHSIVRHWLSKRHGPRYGQSEHVRKPPPKQTSPRHVAWLMLTEPDSGRSYLEEIYRESPMIAATARVAREFVRIIRNRDQSAWDDWLDAARTTALANFAAHLARDQDAVMAALNLTWSNGPVEGQVHRLKLIKRSMYGRAKFDLLRIRVVNAALILNDQLQHPPASPSPKSRMNHLQDDFLASSAVLSLTKSPSTNRIVFMYRSNNFNTKMK